ncbi:MAG: UvrD-helicase domain-containing protein [Bacteroidales bacterium]|nr:UvrD-helicase domain-containing protein [Bacteroidales bacterium]
MSKNKLIIATAGAGKTTFLIREALRIKDGNILIMTYTEANEAEIKKKLFNESPDHKIPNNITIQTWFTFLLKHGVKPYQGAYNNYLFDKEIKGLSFSEGKSGLRYFNARGFPVYWGEEENFRKFYFSSDFKIYSDKLSKFVIACNENTKGEIIDRLSRIYSYILIDEMQDLAGYDLEIIKLLFKSNIQTLLVGDPRQVIYLTHHESKHTPYRDGRMKEFINDKCPRLCDIDEETLKYSHRNNKEICDFSSKLYPNLPLSEPCKCDECRREKSEHEGVYLINRCQIKDYLVTFNPTILKPKNSVAPEWNFGKSKGLTFKRVLIFPTGTIIQYLKDGRLTKRIKGKEEKAFDIAKFYVAITRPQFSAAIVCDYDKSEKFIDGIKKWQSS